MALVKTDSRICFAIDFYDSEEAAQEAHKKVRAAGYTYNGGYFHGMPCGREKQWDHVDKATGQMVYAVTT